MGTVTAVREEKPGNRSTITTVGDVKIHLLVYTVNVYYKAITQLTHNKLISSYVDAHTNRGNYMAKTDWKQGHLCWTRKKTIIFTRKGS